MRLVWWKQVTWSALIALFLPIFLIAALLPAKRRMIVWGSVPMIGNKYWSAAMQEVFAELYRVTRPEGWLAFEVGEVRRGAIRLEEVIAPVGMGVGFECHAVLINAQHFTKTANIWGISNNRLGTNTNRIVIFRKPAP